MKAKLVRFEITSRVIVNDSDTDEQAVEKAMEKVANNPMGYLCHDNVANVEDDNECPYNPEFDTEM
jgi:hypothetical protein